MEAATAMLVNPSAIERVHTGIPGLDHVLEGGFPKGARVLLAGGAGCGKTIYCGQYLYKGATRYGEPGVYVTTEEPPQEFRSNMLRFGWDFKRLEAEKKIGIIDAVYQRVESELAEQESLQAILYNLRSKLAEVKSLVEQIGATRLVVDASRLAAEIQPSTITKLNVGKPDDLRGGRRFPIVGLAV